jgi:hypothetical protein
MRGTHVATNGRAANDDRAPLAEGPLQGLRVVEFEEVEELELLPSEGVM